MLDQRLVFVTGKGGVGRTTVAAALGLASARAGKRTIVAEVAEQERLGVLFDAGPLDHGERELAPGLHGISIDPQQAIEEWLRHQLRSSTLAGALGGSRVFQYLATAAPGLSELVTIGKVWDLAQFDRRTAGEPFDVAIVDAPATGHGVAMLCAPSTYESVARVGPVSRHAGQIHDFLVDPARTAIVAVALPEEMPVNETIDLEARLDDELGRGLDAIVVNAVEPERLKAAEAKRLEALDTHVVAIGPRGTGGAGSPGARSAIEAALVGRRRAAAQQSQVRRLRRAASAPVMTLPRLPTPDVGLDELDELSHALERRL
jgi:anion-transporting  ArsA/GET3 family ATPase